MLFILALHWNIATLRIKVIGISSFIVRQTDLKIKENFQILI